MVSKLSKVKRMLGWKQRVKKPFIVMIGDVGTGKSTIVEKIAEQSGRSGDASFSLTTQSEIFWSYDGSMMIADTPGCNAIQDPFTHNQWVASAINFAPVSKIFIIVKADTRIDSVVTKVLQYNDKLLEIPEELVGVLVSHMDTVGYSDKLLKDTIQEYCQIKDIVLTSKDEAPHLLLRNLKKISERTKPIEFQIDGELFLKIFRVEPRERRALAAIDRRVDHFLTLKEDFDNNIIPAYQGKDLIDILFAFQAWMADILTDMQSEMCEELGYDATFSGPNGNTEAAHCAMLANRLRVIMFEIRKLTAQHAQRSAVDARACNHCGFVWVKVEGCEGATICGNKSGDLPTPVDVRNTAFTTVGRFKFNWNSVKLLIERTNNTEVQLQVTAGKDKVGCGRTITWCNMPRVNTLDLEDESYAPRQDGSEVLPRCDGYKEKLELEIEAKTEKLQLSDSSRPGPSK
eukprot:sb/3464519/